MRGDRHRLTTILHASTGTARRTHRRPRLPPPWRSRGYASQRRMEAVVEGVGASWRGPSSGPRSGFPAPAPSSTAFADLNVGEEGAEVIVNKDAMAAFAKSARIFIYNLSATFCQ